MRNAFHFILAAFGILLPEEEQVYQEAGQGEPCLFLHGNTASSRMFTFLLPLYTQHFRVILLDFLGNGKSQRVDAFPEELWIDQGRQAAELCRHLDCGKVNLVGTSGGAYAAINAALEAPELFGRVVADSFDGSTLLLKLIGPARMALMTRRLF